MRWVILILAAMLLVSCSDDPKKPKPEPEPVLQMQAGSWGEAISHFATAWETKNFELYDSLLTEDYIFYFSPEDIENQDIPPTWNLTQELGAVEALFADADVEDVELNWVPGDMVNPETEGLDGKVLVTNIFLVVDVRDSQGELWNNEIRGNVEFELKKMSYTTAFGDTVWKVARWKDLTTIRTKSEWSRTKTTTWGQLKIR
ncbi:MAG: hypothetical protein KJ970_04515 [Candidatus Eisenbacteria bacterium]|uniref:Uncharacterized protein n=1 Tax=Eiseniibacteriota bacterium TaxID=2212470 RepID=A0A948RXQ6_UNCEI|nr:hypothetical protein [Candidatus Eisenbacteria bacterium]MBU1948162.1 hypothetical protein [Candidatus Eisenbacteria bacterium]MBU2690169.1 hypothetical protein [Candidatus Eisenbacteria bacterium]